MMGHYSWFCCVLFLFVLEQSVSGIEDEDTCVHLLALNVPSKTTPQGETTNYGLTIKGKNVLLTDHPSLFRTVDGGLLDVVGSVAFESQEHPGFFLRQKNYKFHVQKKDDTSSFRKDATFVKIRFKNYTGLYAFELKAHPGWLMTHTATTPFKMVLKKMTSTKGEQLINSAFIMKRRSCTPVSYKDSHTETESPVIIERGVARKDVINVDDDSDEPVHTEVIDEGNPVVHTETDEGPSIEVPDRTKKEPLRKLHVEVIKPNPKAAKQMESKIKTEIFDDPRKVRVLPVTGRKHKDGHRRIKHRDIVGSPLAFNSDDEYSVSRLKKFFDENAMPEPEDKSDDDDDDVNEKGQKFLEVEDDKDDTGNDDTESENDDDQNDDNNDDDSDDDSDSNQNGDTIEHVMDDTNDDDENDDDNDDETNKNNDDEEEQGPKYFVQGENINAEGEDETTVMNKKKRNQRVRKRHHHHKKLFIHKPETNKLIHVRLNHTIPSLPKPLNASITKGICVDQFPAACKEWADRHYCLAFSPLMKKYCKKTCNICPTNMTITAFTNCDKDCGGGSQFRLVRVKNKMILQRRSCNAHACPIDGGYSQFGAFSECSVTCGHGLQFRHRTCDNPVPQHGGRSCHRLGGAVQARECTMPACPNYGMKKSVKPRCRRRLNGGKTGYQSEDSGQVTYDEAGVPVDTTGSVVRSNKGSYQMNVQNENDDRMHISEDCIESDVPLTPEQALNEMNADSENSGDHEQEHDAHQDNLSKFTNHGIYGDLEEYKYEQNEPLEVTTFDEKRPFYKQEDQRIVDDLKSALTRSMAQEVKDEQQLIPTEAMTSSSSIDDQLLRESKLAQMEAKYQSRSHTPIQMPVDLTKRSKMFGKQTKKPRHHSHNKKTKKPKSLKKSKKAKKRTTTAGKKARKTHKV